MKIDDIKNYFGDLIEEQLERIKEIGRNKEITDYSKLDKIIIGILPGDGIGPIISRQALRVINHLLREEIQNNKIEIRQIEGLTIENRVEKMQTVPTEVFEEIQKCHVLLKGPTVTPSLGDEYPNLPSANSALRRGLDLFCQVRRIEAPDKRIDWTFFRENVEGEYVLGSKGLQIDDILAVDFKLLSRINSERLARMAFEFAKNNGKTVVTVITKGNVIKATDGNLIKMCQEVAKEYPGIELKGKYVDVTSAKLRVPEFTKDFQVIILPNLYGDIVTDIAVEYLGGIGAAGAANLGNKKALFEATHGTAPFLIENCRGDYASPTSLLKAVGLMLSHIGFPDKAKLLSEALDICGRKERKIVITSEVEDASAEEYTDYILGKLL